MTAAEPDKAYWALECFVPQDWEDAALLEAAPRPQGVRSWTRGERFPVTISTPLEFTLDPGHTDRMRELDNTQALVMTRRLHEALVEVGVETLDAYPCIIRHPGTGTVATNYVACNVTRKLRVAEATGSDLLFRMAEDPSKILVHRRVKDHLEARSFPMLSFVPVDRLLDVDG